MGFLVNWLAIVVAVFIESRLFAVQISYNSNDGLSIFSLVLGLLNAFVKPIINVLTFPINLLTLGLFSLVINGVLFLLAASLSQTVTVDGFVSALLAALVVSVVNLVLVKLL